MAVIFKNEKGVALLIVSLAGILIFAFSGAFFSMNMAQNKTVELFQKRAQAFNLAEAGLDHALYWLRIQSSPPTGENTNPWGSVQNVGEGSYSVTITDLGVIGGVGHRYKINSTGTFKSINRILTNYVQADNFARYLWFTDKETRGGAPVWFFSLDRLRGPTQTNQHFNIMGTPVFEGKARSVDNYIRFYNNGHNVNLSQLANSPYDTPDFQQGVDFGIEPGTMPTQALNLQATASSGGILLNGNTTVVLNGDGTMDVTNSGNSWVNHNMPLPANGVLYVNAGTLTISGVLNGRLTAVSSRDIIIPNNLIYASDPRVNPGSTDTLSIISEQDVVISSGAPLNLEINGCIMALGASFLMENYWIGPPKGTLTVYGGIVQNERGPVGTFNGSTGQKVSGYSKNYFYDARLLSNPPPYMLTTGDYITLSREEN